MFGFGKNESLSLDTFIVMRGKYDDISIVANIDLGTVKASMNLTDLYSASTVLAFLLDYMKAESKRAVEFAVLTHVLEKSGSDKEKSDALLTLKSAEKWFLDNEPRSYQLCLEAQDQLRAHLSFKKRQNSKVVTPVGFLAKIGSGGKVAEASPEDVQMIALLMAFLTEIDPSPSQKILNLSLSLFVLNRTGTLKERDFSEAMIQKAIAWSIDAMKVDSDNLLERINAMHVRIMEFLRANAAKVS